MVRLLILLWLNIWALSTLAQASVDVYRAELQVADQSESERIGAAKATFGDVIVRVTGDVNALQHPLIREAINNAPNYLLQFSYVSERESTPQDGLKLVLNYSSQAIEKLLRDAQLVSLNAPQGVMLQVTHVQSFADFKQVQAYLKNVAIIRRSELVSTHKDTLLFNLTLTGDAALLRETLNASGKLQASDVITGDTSNLSIQPVSLSFRWQ